MSSRLSKEEIAKQFMLPERKSKIATLLKQDGQAYCICRSSDSSRFMIGCDNCEEWYHGDCISISEKESKYIKQFFCIRCQEEDPTLQTRFKAKRRETDRNSGEKKIKKKKDKILDTYETNNYQKDDDYIYDTVRPSTNSSSKNKKIKPRANKRDARSSGQSRRRKRDSSSDGEGMPEQCFRQWGTEPRQCYAPQCLEQARDNSKYCSEECGFKLATNRIFQVLPQRIQEWSLSQCIAEETNKKTLETIRKNQTEVRIILQELDKRHKELDIILERAKNATINTNAEEEAEEEGEISMYCITCGHEIHSRIAIRHMEKCFNKYESQSSFGSIYKTRIEGNNMFCDYYNSANRTYCKRLRVLCPEHSKDPKVSDNEVCGCPLVTNLFDITQDFCRAPKKSCMKHNCWEKLQRAEVDMERVRQWLKLDELMEKERQTRHALASRAGVLGLMLHSTYNHEAMARMTSAQEQQRLEAIEERFRQSYESAKK